MPKRAISADFTSSEAGNLLIAVHSALVTGQCNHFNRAAAGALKRGIKKLVEVSKAHGDYEHVKDVIERDPRRMDLGWPMRTKGEK